MRWQLNNEKYYIGPVTESQIDQFKKSTLFENSGIACMAQNGKVEIYITLPANEVQYKDLNLMKFIKHDVVM